MENRNEKGQFIKGCKSTGGRPAGSKGISVYIKEKTSNLTELVDLAYKLLYKDDTKTGDKITLLNMLFDRSIGRPQTLIHNTGDLDIVIGGLPKDLEEDDH